MKLNETNIVEINNKQKGITLISLVITIVVLIIVAGVAINMTIGENGIITKARLAKEKEEVASLSEKLELQKANVRLDNNKSVTLDNYLEQLKLDNIIEDIDIEETGEENSRYIEVEDKYIFSVTDLKNGDVKIEYEGKTGKLIPKIKGIEVIKVTTNSISVKVNAIRADDGNYKYYIKNVTNGEEYALKQTSKSDEYTFTGLEQNKEYKIQVEVINKNGNALRETEGNIKTIPVQALTSANINFTYTPNYWTNGKVTVSVSLKDGITIPEGSKIQTSKDAKDWSNTTLQEFNENGYIYVRVWDGINGGSYAVGKVSKIDTTNPVANISDKTSNSITFTGSDTAKSGEQASGIVGYIIQESNAKPSADASWTNYDGTSKTVSGLTQGKTYYLFVKDAAGNVSESSSETTDGVTSITNTNITFTYSPSEWTNGEVKVTAVLKDMISKYTLKITDSNPAGASKEVALSWADASTGITVSSNKAVYAILIDNEGQIGGAASGEVTKIEKTKPTISSITGDFTIVNGNTGTITGSITDSGGSGVKGYYISTNSTTPTATSVTWTSGSSFSKSVTSAGTYYVWAIDNAGNISDRKSCKVSVQTAIARIDSTYYSSVQNAINAGTTSTVILLVDTTESVTIANGKNITFNLDGKTLTGSITNNGTLKLIGGSIIGNTNIALLNETTGNLTISGTNITNNARCIVNSNIVKLESGNIVCTLSSQWTVTNYSANFTMTGGSIVLTDTVRSNGTACMNIGSTVFNMTGGTIKSLEYGLVIDDSATAYVTGGTIEATGVTAVLFRNASATNASFIKNTIIKDETEYAIINETGNWNCIVKNRNSNYGITGNIEGKVLATSNTGAGMGEESITIYNTGYHDIEFATWTTKNDQDDLIWYKPSSYDATTGTASIIIKKSNHNNETGSYIVDIYGKDSTETSKLIKRLALEF